MLPKTRATIIWLCILSFAAISGLGEGLHFLPGCGHPISAGAGCVWMGWIDPGIRLGPGDGVTRVQCPNQDRSATPTADQCPICQHFSFASSVTAGVVFVAVSMLAQALPASDCPQLPPTTAQSFQARAPPQV
jgi:hypothetical protein